MTEFTPIASTLGGLLIGAASAAMLAFNGRIAGISGIVGGIVGDAAGGRGWRIAFLLGLLGGGLLGYAWMPAQFGTTPPAGVPWLILAGLLVGIGTRLGGGCTSGHGVCGIARLSRRSFVATVTFVVVAAATVFVTRHLGGSIA